MSKYIPKDGEPRNGNLAQSLDEPEMYLGTI